MEPLSYTFKQTTNRGLELLLLIGLPIVITPLMFLIFMFLENVPFEGAGFLWAGLLVVGFMGFIFYFFKYKLLSQHIIELTNSGFTCTDLKRDTELRYDWEQVTKLKHGFRDDADIPREYLWIWVNEGKPIYIEEREGQTPALSLVDFRASFLAAYEKSRSQLNS